MSADNGIYILKTKDSYRVRHAQVIENLFWNPFGRYSNEIVPTRAIEIFGDCKFTRDETKALKIAHSMEQNMYTEYGVKMFSTHKSWKRIINEALELAPKEIEFLKNKNNKIWDYEIGILEKIISKYS